MAAGDLSIANDQLLRLNDPCLASYSAHVCAICKLGAARIYVKMPPDFDFSNYLSESDYSTIIGE